MYTLKHMGHINLDQVCMCAADTTSLMFGLIAENHVYSSGRGNPISMVSASMLQYIHGTISHIKCRASLSASGV